MCLSGDMTILQIELKEILYEGKLFLSNFCTSNSRSLLCVSFVLFLK